MCSHVCAPQVTSDAGFVLSRNASSAHRHLLVRGDSAVTGCQSPGLVLCALRGEAVCLEVRCCRVVSPLSLCESVPKYLCYLKNQTKCQMTVVPQQLSIFLLEDLDQRPKNKLATEVQVSLLLGCKTRSRRD